MLKACSCGRIHQANEVCYRNKWYKDNKGERKLRNKHCWAKKSQEVRDKANYLCEVCKDEGKITYDNLEVHHIIKLSEDANGLLDNLNLVCLCQEHHKMADAGAIDKEYLINLAERREENYPPTEKARQDS